MDRPRIFTAHSERAVTIEFPLYNTADSADWIKNRDFYYRFASQNLFAKRDFITGLPPAFYRVYVPGQYFSFASCVTNINITNLGNIRTFDDSYIIPDAFQVSITLSEMLMPSLNQFQALVTGDAQNKVNVLAPTSANMTPTASGNINVGVQAMAQTANNILAPILKN